VAGLVLALQLGSLVCPTLSLAQTASGTPPSSSSQRPQVLKGQEYYEQSRFDEAITLLKDLVDRGALTGDDLQKARELLARSYVKKGYPVQGKEMFKTMLRTDAAYRPDPIRVPPDETAVFDQALKEFQSEKPTGVVPPPAGGAGAAGAAGAGAAGTGAAAAQPTTSTKAAQTGTSSEKAKKPLYKQWWVWVAGAVVIGGVAAAAGGGGGGSSPPPPATLSYFPPTP
jgi:hypothetical protein